MMENQTSDFLGANYLWGDAQIQLEDVQSLTGGVRLRIPSWSQTTVRRIAPTGKEIRYKIPFTRAEKLALLQLFVEQDFLTIAPAERSGIPDETRPFISLSNSKGEKHTVSKWVDVQDARFDPLYDALLMIAERSKPIKPEPKRLRPYQKTIFIVGLILFILTPFVFGNLLARGIAYMWWPEDIGSLIALIPLLSLGVIIMLAGLYWRERDKPNREQRITNPTLWTICAILLLFVMLGFLSLVLRFWGLLQNEVMLPWAIFTYTFLFATYLIIIGWGMFAKQISRFMDTRIL